MKAQALFVSSQTISTRSAGVSAAVSSCVSSSFRRSLRVGHLERSVTQKLYAAELRAARSNPTASSHRSPFDANHITCSLAVDASHIAPIE